MSAAAESMSHSRADRTRRVMVPDASTRAALAAIRSLGRHGCRVFAGTPDGGCLGVRSRYCVEPFLHPDPAVDPTGFVSKVAAEAARLNVGAILPAADIPANALIAQRHQLPADIKLLVPPLDALDLAHDKIRLAELAESIGVAVPRGITVTERDSLETAVREIGFPVILKPRRSRLLIDGRWTAFGVSRAADRGELDACLADQPALLDVGLLVQEVVPGEGRGVFVLARDGEISCTFAHRRIREKPPSGGVSTLCESAIPEPLLVEDSTKLMHALRWSGLAMVEFKWDPAGRRRWLMEINGRLWGSVQLAIESGVDFPWLLFRQESLGETIPPPQPRTDVRLWWCLGDLDHFLIRGKTRGVREIPSMLRDLVKTRQGRHLAIDTWNRRDPGPFFYETKQWIKDVLRVRA